jgi:alkanesulfonate monooxygenase SsuD/methylene tetrahydromethanopterin reductase-like flavin-dependent oxidoreductase (luciferase family)
MFAWQVVPWPVLRDDVLYLEKLGIGTVWIGDSFVLSPSYGTMVLEAWTTLAALADCTQRVRLGTMVSDIPLRHPAMLAKQAATVDCISGGRLDLGVGPGDNFSGEIRSLGLPSLAPGARVDRLREAVEVIDKLLRAEELTFHGEYYHLDEATLSPEAVQRPRPPLAIAAQGPRGIRVAAEYADIWVTMPSGKTLEEQLQGVRERNEVLDEHCIALGRDPQTVERAYLPGWGGPERPFASSGAFQDFVGRCQEAGVQRFIFSFGSDVFPSPYREWVASGAWASRESLEAFAAQAMTA